MVDQAGPVGVGVVAVLPGGADHRTAVGPGIRHLDEPAGQVIGKTGAVRRARVRPHLIEHRPLLSERQPGGARFGVGQHGGVAVVVEPGGGHDPVRIGLARQLPVRVVGAGERRRGVPGADVQRGHQPAVLGRRVVGVGRRAFPVGAGGDLPVDVVAGGGGVTIRVGLRGDPAETVVARGQHLPEVVVGVFHRR